MDTTRGATPGTGTTSYAVYDITFDLAGLTAEELSNVIDNARSSRRYFGDTSQLGRAMSDLEDDARKELVSRA